MYNIKSKWKPPYYARTLQSLNDTIDNRVKKKKNLEFRTKKVILFLLSHRDKKNKIYTHICTQKSDVIFLL